MLSPENKRNVTIAGFHPIFGMPCTAGLSVVAGFPGISDVPASFLILLVFFLASLMLLLVRNVPVVCYYGRQHPFS
jgi:hypothetical protein